MFAHRFAAVHRTDEVLVDDDHGEDAAPGPPEVAVAPPAGVARCHGPTEEGDAETVLADAGLVGVAPPLGDFERGAGAVLVPVDPAVELLYGGSGPRLAGKQTLGLVSGHGGKGVFRFSRVRV